MWWLAGILGVIIYTIVKFVILKPTKLPKPEKEQVRLSPIHTNYSNENDTIKEDDDVMKEYYNDNTSDKKNIFDNNTDNALIVDINRSDNKIQLANSGNNPKDKNV